MKDVSARMELLNTVDSAFVSKIARVFYVGKSLSQAVKSKKTVTRANVKKAYGNVQIWHVVHAAERLVILII